MVKPLANRPARTVTSTTTGSDRSRTRWLIRDRKASATMTGISSPPGESETNGQESDRACAPQTTRPAFRLARTCAAERQTQVQECSETASERDRISIATHQAGSTMGAGEIAAGSGRSGRPYPCPGRHPGSGRATLGVCALPASQKTGRRSPTAPTLRVDYAARSGGPQDPFFKILVNKARRF